jgi:hypothetical protein
MRPLLNAFRRHPKGTALLLVLILNEWGFASMHPGDNSTTEIVAEWDFGSKVDKEPDGWPDKWTRRTGRDYPKFIPIAIHQNAVTPEALKDIEEFRRFSSQCYLGWEQRKWPWQVIPEKVPAAIDQFLERTVLNPYLRVQMNGGMVEISSEIIPVDVRSVYYMTARIHSDSTDYEANVKLRFMDELGKTLFEMPTKFWSGKTGWKSVSTDSQYPYRKDIAKVQVVAQVQPKSIKAYRGEFGFDAIRIFRTPRLSLSVDKPLPFYTTGEKIVLRCTANGMTSEQPSIEFVLVDHAGQTVRSATKLLTPDAPQPSILISTREPQPKFKSKPYWDGKVEWIIENLEPGYYEITTKLGKGKAGGFDLDEQFVVLPNEQPKAADPRFGWTMSPRKNNLNDMSTSRLLEILRFGHVGKVKLPIWYDFQDPVASKSARDRIDRLHMAGIGCVGVIASPPTSLLKHFPRHIPDESGSDLEDSLTVQTFLEPVMREMCVRISDFQIGWDYETELVANPRLRPSLESIKTLSSRYGQDAQLIAAKNPTAPQADIAQIDRWQLHSTKPFTAAEAANANEKRQKPEFGIQNPWLSLTPINATDYSLAVRVQDLAARMLQVASESVLQQTTAWISNPSDQQVGVLDVDGGPREMFLPFRSISRALSGMRQIGSLPIPSLGVNHLIVGGDQAKIIAWSTRPTTAQLYLGDNVTAHDVWGRSVKIGQVMTQNGTEQRIAIDKWPIIIDDIDVRAARWRMGIGLEDPRIDPLVGQIQELRVLFANPFGSRVAGQVTIIAKSILVEDATANFDVEAKSNSVITVPVRVKPDANTAAAAIQMKFSVQGDASATFVVDQEIQVGTSDFTIETRYEINNDNQLRLTLEATNHKSIPLSFNCILLVPDRPRERTQISGLKDQVTKTITLDDASDLIGKTVWLRCEQIGSNRILNYRIEIRP